MHIIFESVPMLLTENYQNCSILVEATAWQTLRIFFSVVGVLSCRESSASTVNSGVGF